MGVDTLRLLVFRERAGEHEVWVGQCLDHDIAVQGETLREVLDSFVHVVLGTIIISLEHGIPPLVNLPPPPPSYGELWEGAVKLADTLPVAPWSDGGRAEVYVRVAA
jgi:hypothetical protein